MNFYFCCQGLGKKIEKYYLSDTVLVNDIDKKVISLEGQAKNNKKTVNTPPGVFGLLLIFLLLALRFFKAFITNYDKFKSGVYNTY